MPRVAQDFPSALYHISNYWISPGMRGESFPVVLRGDTSPVHPQNVPVSHGTPTSPASIPPERNLVLIIFKESAGKSERMPQTAERCWTPKSALGFTSRHQAGRREPGANFNRNLCPQHLRVDRVSRGCGARAEPREMPGTTAAGPGGSGAAAGGNWGCGKGWSLLRAPRRGCLGLLQAPEAAGEGREQGRRGSHPSPGLIHPPGFSAL